MHAAAACFDLHVPESRSLKTKRAAIRPIVDGLRHRFRVSVAEVDHQDQWQRAAIGVALVGIGRAAAGECSPRSSASSSPRPTSSCSTSRPDGWTKRELAAQVSAHRARQRIDARGARRRARAHVGSATRAGDAHRRRGDARSLARNGLLLDARCRDADTTGNDAEAAAAALRTATPHLRGVVGKQLRIRQVPKLTFELDPGIIAGQRIEEILRGEVGTTRTSRMTAGTMPADRAEDRGGTS